MITHSRILVRKIPWTEKPGQLQSMGLQSDGHDWAHTHWWPNENSLQLLYRLQKKAFLKGKNMPMTQNEATVLFWNCVGKLAKENPPRAGPCPGLRGCTALSLRRATTSGAVTIREITVTQFSERGTKSIQLLLTSWEASQRTDIKSGAQEGICITPEFSKTRGSSQARFLTDTPFVNLKKFKRTEDLGHPDWVSWFLLLTLATLTVLFLKRKNRVRLQRSCPESSGEAPGKKRWHGLEVL